jgi:hypothetical protein
MSAGDLHHAVGTVSIAEFNQDAERDPLWLSAGPVQDPSFLVGQLHLLFPIITAEADFAALPSNENSRNKTLILECA